MADRHIVAFLQGHMYMLDVFAADSSDLKWMSRLLIHASNKGHFIVENTRAGRDFQKANLQSIIINGMRLDEPLRSQAMVFEDNQQKVGFVVMSEIYDGYGNEIYMFIVDRDYRGKGYGRQMLDEIIRRWHPTSAIQARCHKQSGQMTSMLKKSGFTCVDVLKQNAEVYRLDKASGMHYQVAS